MPDRPKVYFFFQEVNPTLRHRNDLKRFIEYVFKQEGKIVDTINYIFCTDNALLDINRKFLKHDFYTDIITFDLSESDVVTAEIYISVDRVKENALQHKTSFKQELYRVLFHGVLHLCGYGDKKEEEIQLMRKKEDFYLRAYFG